MSVGAGGIGSILMGDCDRFEPLTTVIARSEAKQSSFLVAAKGSWIASLRSQ
jgi:hypothetical protein